MSEPTPEQAKAQSAAGKTALTDEDNVGWVEVPAEPLTEEEAYWRMRGMIPPAQVDLEE